MKRVFVYGTLMQGERASSMLKSGVYKGEYMLDGYATYDLGPFPAIKEEKGGIVTGELYEIPDTLIERLDAYESEGSLYKRATVSVKNEKNREDNVFVYVYMGSVNGSRCIKGRWTAGY